MKPVHKLSIIIFAVLAISYFWSREETPVEKAATKKTKGSRSIANVSEEQISFNRAYPPPKQGRGLAQLPNHFDTFEKVKEYYKLSKTSIELDGKKFFQSQYRTMPNSHDNLGRGVAHTLGYQIFEANEEEDREKHAPLLVDKQTWMPTIITGKIYIKYKDQAHAEQVKQALKDNGYSINFHHESINIYEVKVVDTGRTLHESQKIQRYIKDVRVTLELKNSEYIPL